MADKKEAKIGNKELLSDFLQFWQLVKKNWKWFPISIVTCLFLAGFYLWFKPTTVNVTGKMEIIDKSKNGSGVSASMALLNSLPMGLGSSLGGSSIGIASEKEVIMSNMFIRNIVKDLGVYSEYRLSKWGRKTLLYKNTPITVSLDSAHVQWLDAELPLTSHKIRLTVNKSSNGYRVKTTLVENNVKKDLPTQTFATLPATIETEAGRLTITGNDLSPKQAKAYEKSYTLIITLTPPTEVADAFLSRLSLAPPTKSVNNMLNITLRDENLIRGIDFVNRLVDVYNQRANDDKNEEARKTDEFVNARLAKIDVELGSSDDAWENSKKQYQITTLEVDAEEALTKKSQYESQLISMGSNLQLHDYLNDYINDPKNLYELIPIGIMGSSTENQTTSAATRTSSFIAQHNQLVNQRKNLLKSLSEKSPQVQRLTESIQDLHPTILLSMKRDREQLVMQKNTLEREYARYSGRIGTAPQMERVFTEIGRERQIKQSVYLLLLQKREETAMELANTTDKGRLIDDVRADSGSTSPKKKIVLLAAFFFGVLLPLSIVYMKLILKVLKLRIDTQDELEAISKHPFLVEISAFGYDESIRNLRTNLLLNLKPEQKVILVASQNEGDGKTFIAQHLVDSLNAIGKKSLYINADMRKLEKGHPADIIASDDFAQQIEQAKATNDYVIIDSPAINQYIDAFQLAPFADATLYVIKAGLTFKTEVESLNDETRLPQPMLVFNNYTIKK